MTSWKSDYSWWWNSHISPKNSRWLTENLEQMDRLIKEMLMLIEEDGDSFSKKADMYYLRRPELISHLGDFFGMYRALAERYDIVTGELHKNISSELQSQSSGSGSDFGRETTSPSFSSSADRTPNHNQILPKPFSRAAGFDVFLGSTACSSIKGSDENCIELPIVLDARIIQLDDELRKVRQKFKENEKCSNGQCTDLVSTDENHTPENEIVAEDVLVVLEADMSNHKGEIICLKEGMEDASKQFEKEILLKGNTIEEYKAYLDGAMRKFMQEKLTLEAELKSSNDVLKLEATHNSEKKSSLEIRIWKMEQMIEELKAMSAETFGRLLHEKTKLDSKVRSLMESESSRASKLQAFEDRVREMEAEKTGACNESAKHIDELNRNLDESKLKIGMLTSEKDVLNARMRELVDDVKCRDDNCESMTNHLHQLHFEKVNLIKEIEEARKDSVELMNRVRELEVELEKQRLISLDVAEGKREAIRQLCFSIEHYRDGYEKLRKIQKGQTKRLIVMAT